jgi:hypothetical protein
VYNVDACKMLMLAMLMLAMLILGQRVLLKAAKKNRVSK